MSSSDTLPIYIDTYQLTREIYLITHKFPREFKYCLGEQINRDVLKLLYHIFQANHIKSERSDHIRRFLASLDMVRVEIRLAHDMKVLSTRQISHLAQFMDKIVKQANAWQKYEQVKSRKEVQNEIGLPELDRTDTPSAQASSLID